MSASHFGFGPTLALQLASRVDAYVEAMRRLAQQGSGGSGSAAGAASLREIVELARPVPSLWREWGRFAVASAEFGLRVHGDRTAPEFGHRLDDLDASADALIGRCLNWALFEQLQFPVSLELVGAFIDWDAARKLAYEIRQAAAASRSGSKDSDGDLGPQELREWQSKWESRSAELRNKAQMLLQRRA